MNQPTPLEPRDPQDSQDLGAQVHQLLLRAAQPAPGEGATADAVLQRAHRRGRVRLRRRRTAWAAGAAAAAVLAVAGLTHLPGTREDALRLVPAAPAPASSPVTSGVEVPLPERGGDHLLDLPGDPTFDWRAQVAESLRRYPGTFVLPEQLPPGVHSVQANTINGHPVTDVMEEGPGVLVCALDEATCREQVARTWDLVRTSEVEGRLVRVFASPPQEPGDEGMPRAQRRFWETVTLTTAPPAWLHTDR
ncbi:hypothetical protein [Kineococcus sp. SYSU DK005]|uniref:hypothetical protein n=1 Tax=Kineococcus sp. SYSU DK005 TaxID=3383126 RepID=UPI003D7C5A46